MSVSLREISKENYEQVLDLELTDAQQGHLSSNARSLVESHYHPEALYARAIYHDEEVVGFLMWAIDLPDEALIFRFMVDVNWQKKGIGRKALALAIKSMREHPGVGEIEICYHPDNTVARKLYLDLGFEEKDMSGEDMMAGLKADREPS